MIYLYIEEFPLTIYLKEKIGRQINYIQNILFI